MCSVCSPDELQLQWRGTRGRRRRRSSRIYIYKGGRDHPKNLEPWAGHGLSGVTATCEVVYARYYRERARMMRRRTKRNYSESQSRVSARCSRRRRANCLQTF